MLLRKIFVACFLAILSTQPARALEPDWSAYAALLEMHVHTGTKHGTKLALVDYAALKKNGKLNAVYRQIAGFRLEQLAAPAEKLTFYINAYNILAIKMVLDHWPLESIKDAGNLLRPVWDKPAGELGGEEITLGRVEHEILRPMGEPRIHFAIVCASVSCPDLLDKPYTAAALDAQLDQQARSFLNNAQKGITVTDDEIRVSKIFDWFEDDFAPLGGVEAFIRKYRPDLPALPLESDIPYDWAVNAAE